MSKTNAFETSILTLLFVNTNLAGIGDGTGLVKSTADGTYSIALFTADPGEAGAMTNECDYTGYARKTVARGAAQWTVTDDTVVNDNVITFDACGGGSNTVTYFGICKADVEGVTDMIYSAQLTAPRTVSTGITPEFAAGDLTVTEG
jgi:hypothetical protein